jgi:hypothetical protein
LAAAIRSAASEGDAWAWHRLDLAATPPEAPAQLLFARFITNASADQLRNAGTLARHPVFSGQFVWLEGFSTSAWPAWKRFLCDFSHASRGVGLLERSLFCAVLRGQLALDPPPEDVCLVHHSWRGRVEPLDLLLFTARLFQNRGMTPLQKQVAVSVAAGLALWDPAVSLHLAHKEIADILAPELALRELAGERGWDIGIGPPSWETGAVDEVLGEKKIHSAYLAIDDPRGEIRRRIWSAQVGILLPFVEEQRQDLLARLQGILRVPFRTRFGEEINDLRDLEIGHIESQLLTGRRSIDSDLLRLVRRLREIRNSLSHLETINSVTLEDWL